MREVTTEFYHIEYDETDRLLLIRLKGFWQMETLHAFMADVTAVGGAGSEEGDFAVLTDAREFEVQATDVSEAFTEMIEAAGALTDSRYALVVGSTLSKLQAKRLHSEGKVRIFEDIEEARGWLLAKAV